MKNKHIQVMVYREDFYLYDAKITAEQYHTFGKFIVFFDGDLIVQESAYKKIVEGGEKNNFFLSLKQWFYKRIGRCTK